MEERNLEDTLRWPSRQQKLMLISQLYLFSVVYRKLKNLHSETVDYGRISSKYERLSFSHTKSSAKSLVGMSDGDDVREANLEV